MVSERGIVEIMVDMATTTITSHEVREQIMQMMQEVIAQKLGNRERSVESDNAAT